MSSAAPTLVVFDFDDTLTRGDSMWSFFARVGGRPKMALAGCQAEIFYLLHRLGLYDHPVRGDRGTFFKQEMLNRLIAGHRVESFAPIVAELKQSLRWNETMRAKLREHYEQGHHVVIASGSLDLYLPELVKDLPHHALLCTNIEVINGVATGVMSLGNCVRQGKAQRVAAYIEQHGPFGDSWGYGNAPDDLPMMNLLKYRVVV